MRVITGNICLLILGGLVALLDAQTIPVVARTTSEKPSLSCELFVQKKQRDFFVGEMIPFVVRCTFDPQEYTVRMITPPHNSEIGMSDLPQATTEQRTIHDVSCIVYEWQSSAYAKKSGEHEFGPFQVGGERAAHASHGFFRMMMNSSFKAYSNTVKLAVRPLPQSPSMEHYKGMVPVGDFHAVHFECERFTMKTGEAQTIRYILEGSGNGLLLDHPILDLPEGLKYYPAEKKQESPTKFIFEYIIQAVEPGIITIPAQQFLYFDPDLYDLSEDAPYRTLKTASVRLHITPGFAVPHEKQEVSPEEENKEDEPCETVQNNEQSFESKPSFVRAIQIPAPVFIGIVLLLVIHILYLVNFDRLHALRNYFQQLRNYRRLVRQAREGYKIFEKEGDIIMLYESFKELSDIYPPHSQAWDEFFNYLKGKRFGRKANQQDVLHETSEKIDVKKYSKEICLWIDYFEKKLWKKK